jgi:hypothetical protein
MDELEITLVYLKEVLETVPGVNFVSHGKPTAISIDDKMTSVYIVPTNEAFVNTLNKKTLCGYDNYVYVKLHVNMECTYDLEWVSMRTSIINAVLSDSDIWKGIVDRELTATVHDDYDNHPKKSFQIGFEFRLRTTA